MTIARSAIVAALSALALAVNPVAGDTTVNVSLVEFAVSASPGNAPTGTVNFQITNNGATFHNFRVVATDLPAGDLPIDQQTNSVDESQLNVVASTGDVLPGQSTSVSPTLPAGNYVLFCNIPGHYNAGQYLAFQVTAIVPPTATTAPGEPSATPGGPAATPGGPDPIDAPGGGAAPTVFPETGFTAGASSGSEWIAIAVAAAGAALIWAGAIIYRHRPG